MLQLIFHAAKLSILRGFLKIFQSSGRFLQQIPAAGIETAITQLFAEE
jgi:hypothetical protein